MKSYRKAIMFNTAERTEFINITKQIEESLVESQIQEGFMVVNSMHITSSVFVNDDEPGLHYDIMHWLENLVPFEPKFYRHTDTKKQDDNNADAHIKREIMGRSVTIAVTEGKLDLGPFEQIFYGEFDGKKPKRILIKIIGE